MKTMIHNEKKQITSHVNIFLKKLNSALQEQEHVHQCQQKTLFSHLKIKRQDQKFLYHNQNQQEFFLEYLLSDRHTKEDRQQEEKESGTVLSFLEAAQTCGTEKINLPNLFWDAYQKG